MPLIGAIMFSMVPISIFQSFLEKKTHTHKITKLQIDVMFPLQTSLVLDLVGRVSDARLKLNRNLSMRTTTNGAWLTALSPWCLIVKFVFSMHSFPFYYVNIGVTTQLILDKVPQEQTVFSRLEGRKKKKQVSHDRGLTHRLARGSTCDFCTLFKVVWKK